MTKLSDLTYTDFNTLLITKCLWEQHYPNKENGVKYYFLAERHIFMDWVCDAFHIQDVRDSKLAETILHHFTWCIGKELDWHNKIINPKPPHNLSQFTNYHFLTCIQRAQAKTNTSTWIREYNFPFAVLFWTMLVHTELDEEEAEKTDGGFWDTASQLWKDSDASKIVQFRYDSSLASSFKYFAISLHLVNTYQISDPTLPTIPLLVDLESFISVPHSVEGRSFAKKTLERLGFIETTEPINPEQFEKWFDDEQTKQSQSIRWKKVQLPHYTNIGQLPPSIGPYSTIGFCKLMGFPSAADTKIISKMLDEILNPGTDKERSLSQLGTQNNVLVKMKRLAFGKYSAGPITQKIYSSLTRLPDAKDWWTTLGMVYEYYNNLGSPKQVQSPTRIHLAFDREDDGKIYLALIINKQIELTYMGKNVRKTLPMPIKRFSGDKLWWKLSRKDVEITVFDDVLNGFFKNYGVELQKQLQQHQIWMEDFGNGSFRSFKNNRYPFDRRFVCLAREKSVPTYGNWQKKPEFEPITDAYGSQWFLYINTDYIQSIEAACHHLHIDDQNKDDITSTLDIQGLTHMSQLLGFKWLRPSFQRIPEVLDEILWKTNHGGTIVNIPLEQNEDDTFLFPDVNLVGTYEDSDSEMIYHFTCDPIYFGFPRPPSYVRPAEFDGDEENLQVEQIYCDAFQPIEVFQDLNANQCWFGNEDSTPIHVGDVIVDEIQKCDFWDAESSLKDAQAFNLHIKAEELQNIFDELHKYVVENSIKNIQINMSDLCVKVDNLIRNPTELEEFEQCLMSLLQGSRGNMETSGIPTFGLGHSGKVRSVLDLLHRQLITLTLPDPHAQAKEFNWVYGAHKALYSMGLVESYYKQNRHLAPNVQHVPPWPYTSYGVQPHVVLYQLQKTDGSCAYEATLCGLACPQIKEVFRELVKKCGGEAYKQQVLSPLVPVFEKARFASQEAISRFKNILQDHPDLPYQHLQMPHQWDLQEQIQSFATHSECTFGALNEREFAKLRIWNWENGGWKTLTNPKEHLERFGVLVLFIEYTHHPSTFYLVFKSNHPFLNGLERENLHLTAIYGQQVLNVDNVVRFATRIQRDALFIGFMFVHAYQTFRQTEFFPVARGIDFPLYISRFLTIISDSNHGPLITIAKAKYPIQTYESVYMQSLIQQLIKL